MLMGKLIGRQLSWSFKRAKVGKDDIAGGSLINWLRRSAPKSYAQAQTLATRVLDHSQAWITPTVDHRDTIIHYGEIRGLKHMRVVLIPAKPCFIESTIADPEMPNGLPLVQWSARVIGNTKAFVRETVSLLPNVQMNQVSFEKFLENY
jgi:hypothetical protein